MVKKTENELNFSHNLNFVQFYHLFLPLKVRFLFFFCFTSSRRGMKLFCVNTYNLRLTLSCGWSYMQIHKRDSHNFYSDNFSLTRCSAASSHASTHSMLAAKHANCKKIHLAGTTCKSYKQNIPPLPCCHPDLRTQRTKPYRHHYNLDKLHGRQYHG